MGNGEIQIIWKWSGEIEIPWINKTMTKIWKVWQKSGKYDKIPSCVYCRFPRIWGVLVTEKNVSSWTSRELTSGGPSSCSSWAVNSGKLPPVQPPYPHLEARTLRGTLLGVPWGCTEVILGKCFSRRWLLLLSGYCRCWIKRRVMGDFLMFFYLHEPASLGYLCSFDNVSPQITDKLDSGRY